MSMCGVPDDVYTSMFCQCTNEKCAVLLRLGSEYKEGMVSAIFFIYLFCSYSQDCCSIRYIEQDEEARLVYFYTCAIDQYIVQHNNICWGTDY